MSEFSKEKGLEEIDTAKWQKDQYNQLNLCVTNSKGDKIHCFLSLRPDYCDRGHIQLLIDGNLNLDGQDSFPRFFFSFEEADKHTRLFLKWRLWKYRVYPHRLLAAKEVEIDEDNPLLCYYKNSAYLSDKLDGAPIKIGSRVCKCNSENQDLTKDGMLGVVVGSISYPVSIKGLGSEYLYGIVWDDNKEVAVNTVGKKLKLIDQEIKNV